MGDDRLLEGGPLVLNETRPSLTWSSTWRMLAWTLRSASLVSAFISLYSPFLANPSKRDQVRVAPTFQLVLRPVSPTHWYTGTGR